MKPVSVRFKSFGPYLREQYIDFAQLEKGGLFLICGDTGSGKTTILDAICCALYGESSGGSRGSLEVMRCKIASREDNTLVELVFDNNGRRYKFVRELKFARKHLNDFHNCAVEEGGVYVPLLENPTKNAVNAMAVKILGLTVSQFRQVIILPQGKFETLLTSDSAAKEAILTSIFDAEKWDRIARSVAEEVKERDTALKAEIAALQAVWMRYGCENVTAMEQRLGEEQAALESMKAALDSAKAAYADIQKTLEAMIAEHHQFDELDMRRARYDKLLAENAGFEAEEQRLKLADEAEKWRPMYEAYMAAQERYTQAKADVSAACEEAARSETVRREAETALAAHEETASAVEAMGREAVRLQEKKTVYESLPIKRRQIQDAEEQLEHSAALLEQAVDHQTACEQALLECRERQTAAMTACEAAEERYFRGIGGILAANLKEGCPCPVCGSEHHPAPAAADEGSLSEEEFKIYKEKRQQAIAAFDAAQADATAARDAAAAIRRRYQETQQHVRTVMYEWESALAMKVDGIDTAEQLEERLCICSEAAARYTDTQRALQEAFTAAVGAAKGASVILKERREVFREVATARETAQQAWNEALAASPFEKDADFEAAKLPFEVRESRKAALGNAGSALRHAFEELTHWQERVGDKPRPRLDEQKELSRQAEEELTAKRQQLVLAQAACDELARDTADAKARLAAYREGRQKADADLEFSRRINGSTGISLKRYVLGVMLTNITVQANRLLSQVYGGRYRLYRTDDIAGSGHKGGLELEVLDSYSNERRSVTTLSGGEKFLVALSLAIGLSAVVQAAGKGVRLEAMFVDEGFGSLSREAVNDAIEILQGVQQSNGIVGIISHVDKLAETIPNRIEIVKTSRGSDCRVICN